jgi:uncharacterized protein YdhG (YjbR/CyaY superfamily)
LAMKRPETVDEYIAAFPEQLQQKIEAIRGVVKEEAPDATEKLSYGMPYFDLNGRLLYYAAFKNHISIFAMPSAIVHFAGELTDYQTSKGTIQFPLDKPLPLDLIRKIARFRAEQNLSKQK